MIVGLYSNCGIWILKIYCRRKSIFHKHWHTHQLSYSLTRPTPFGQWPVSCLSWVRSEDRMAAASTCSANWTCLSAVAEHRHTLWGYELSVYWGGGGHPGTDASSLTGRHVNLAIYLHFLPSALTHLTALWLLWARAFAKFSIRTAI